MVELLLIFIIGLMLPFFLLGLVTFVYWVKPELPDGVTDVSNRFNRIRASWWALTRRKDLITSLPWLAFDEKKNLE